MVWFQAVMMSEKMVDGGRAPAKVQKKATAEGTTEVTAEVMANPAEVTANPAEESTAAATIVAETGTGSKTGGTDAEAAVGTTGEAAAPEAVAAVVVLGVAVMARPVGNPTSVSYVTKALAAQEACDQLSFRASLVHSLFNCSAPTWNTDPMHSFFKLL
jgi:cobalamin biosynthesis Mg chelatase CobN